MSWSIQLQLVLEQSYQVLLFRSRCLQSPQLSGRVELGKPQVGSWKALAEPTAAAGGWGAGMPANRSFCWACRCSCLPLCRLDILDGRLSFSFRYSNSVVLIGFKSSFFRFVCSQDEDWTSHLRRKHASHEQTFLLLLFPATVVAVWKGVEGGRGGCVCAGCSLVSVQKKIINFKLL